MSYSKWNIVVKDVSKLDKPGKFLFKTTVGDVTSTRAETVPNKKIYSKQEGSPITGLGYILNPKGNIVEVTLFAEFEEEEQEMVLGMAGDMFIDSLRKYAEYLESGGKPDKYNKKKA
jgi:hypothetical protein